MYEQQSAPTTVCARWGNIALGTAGAESVESGERTERGVTVGV